LSSVLPFINIYVCTMFNFNPFSTFQDMARVSNHYDKKWLMGDNSVIQCIQFRVINLMHCTSSHCHLSIIQCSFQSLLYFPRYGPDRHPLWKNKWLRGDNSVNRQVRIMVLVYCTSSHCHLSIYQV